MNVDRLLTQTAVITTRTESEDADLDVVVTESETTSACYLEPAGTDETYAGADMPRLDGVCFLPTSTIVDHVDAITIDGARYEAIGDAERFWNPRTRSYTHQRVRVRRSAS